VNLSDLIRFADEWGEDHEGSQYEEDKGDQSRKNALADSIVGKRSRPWKGRAQSQPRHLANGLDQH